MLLAQTLLDPKGTPRNADGMDEAAVDCPNTCAAVAAAKANAMERKRQGEERKAAYAAKVRSMPDLLVSASITLGEADDAFAALGGLCVQSMASEYRCPGVAEPQGARHTHEDFYLLRVWQIRSLLVQGSFTGLDWRGCAFVFAWSPLELAE